MSSASACIVVEADLNRPDHQQAVVALTDAYAQDPMGNCEALPKTVCEELIPALRRHPTTVIFLAYAGSKAIGIATCFYGFSTFAARPLLNIHDLAVLPEHRAQGVGKALLQAVEAKARAQGCVKLTLEVLENNRRARSAYESMGFGQAAYAPEAGGALFYSKTLLDP